MPLWINGLILTKALNIITTLNHFNFISEIFIKKPKSNGVMVMEMR